MQVDWRALREQAVEVEATAVHLRPMSQAEWDQLSEERRLELLKRYAPQEYRRLRRLEVRRWFARLLDPTVGSRQR
jgi:hypothetical protein